MDDDNAAQYISASSLMLSTLKNRDGSSFVRTHNVLAELLLNHVSEQVWLSKRTSTE